MIALGPDKNVSVGARFITLENGYAKEGFPSFNAGDPVFDWSAIRTQMIWLHDHRRAA